MSSVTVQFNMNLVTPAFNMDPVVAGALFHLCFSDVMGFSGGMIECNHNSTLSPILILHIIVNKG